MIYDYLTTRCRGKRFIQDEEFLEDENIMSVRDLYSSPIGIARRAKKSSSNKLSPSFKKILRNGCKSVMGDGGDNDWATGEGVSHPRRAVKIGAFYSPQGAGFMGDHKNRLEPLPFYRKDRSNTTGGKKYKLKSGGGGGKSVGGGGSGGVRGDKTEKKKVESIMKQKLEGPKIPGIEGSQRVLFE